MSVIHLYCSLNQIALLMPDQSDQQTARSIAGREEDLLSHLPDLLAQIEPGEGDKIRLILGPTISRFHFFQFPYLRSGKLDKLLGFELENRLFSPVEEVHYQFSASHSKEENTSQVGVYVVRRQLLERLLEICRSAGFEVERVHPFISLLEESIRSINPRPEGLYLFFEERACRMLLFQGGQLAACSSLEEEEGRFLQLLAEAEKRLKAIVFTEGETKVRLDGRVREMLEISDDFNLTLKEKGSKRSLQSLFSLDQCNLKLQNRAINLLPQPLFNLNLKQLQAQWGNFKKTAIALGVFLSVYFIASAYQIYHESQSLDKLNREFTQLARTYMPGVREGRVLRSLNEKLKSFRESDQGKEGFQTGPYPVSELLLALGKLKEGAASLRVIRLTLSTDSLTLQGELSDLVSFEKLQAQAKLLFPPDRYRLRFSQQSQGELVTFSLNVTKGS